MYNITCTIIKDLVIFCLFDCFLRVAGGKVAQSSKRGISIADTSGQQLSLGNAAEGDTLKGTVGFMWYHAQEARGHCISIEEFMSRIPGTHNFPVRIGREPKRT